MEEEVEHYLNPNIITLNYINLSEEEKNTVALRVVKSTVFEVPEENLIIRIVHRDRKEIK